MKYTSEAEGTFLKFTSLSLAVVTVFRNEQVERALNTIVIEEHLLDSNLFGYTFFKKLYSEMRDGKKIKVSQAYGAL